MIVAKRKPLKEIMDLIKSYKKILNVGCGTCVSVCMTGGEKEVTILNIELGIARRIADNPIELDGITLERQCNRDYLEALDSTAPDYEAILSMACGAGIQFLAERFPDKPVFPAVDTIFIGINQSIGWYEERCLACNSCVLGMTAGICPVTMCAKGLFHGPCGNASKDRCESDPEIPCAWVMIHERLSGQGRLDCIMGVTPPVDWGWQRQRSLVQPGFKKPEKIG